MKSWIHRLGRVVAACRAMAGGQAAKAGQPDADGAGTGRPLEVGSAMLLAQLSHDIRAPLAGIRLLMQGLGRDSQCSALVDEVEQSVQYLLNLSESYLHMVRTETRLEGPSEGGFDLTTVVTEALNLVKRRAEEKQLRLIVDWHSVDLRVQGIALPIKQILINLLTNAIKFTQTGHVVVAVRVASGRSEGAALTLLVSDTGPGLKDDVAARAFEPFVQLHGADSAHPHGFGLGLAIVKSLAEMSGGGVSAADLPGGGLQVSVTLKSDWTRKVPPVAHRPTWVRACWVLDAYAPAGLALVRDLQAMGVHEARWLSATHWAQHLHELQSGDLVICDESLWAAAGPWLTRETQAMARVSVVHMSDVPGPALPPGVHRSPRIAPSAHLMAHHLPSLPAMPPMGVPPKDRPKLPEKHQGKSLLLVDDSRVNQIIVGDFLRALGFHVLMADNGADALEVVSGIEVDLVLTDLAMPVLDGLGLLQEIRKRALWMPVVALTGTSAPEVRSACLRNGMAAYLVKPLDFDEALDTLVATLEREPVEPRCE